MSPGVPAPHEKRRHAFRAGGRDASACAKKGSAKGEGRSEGAARAAAVLLPRQEKTRGLLLGKGRA